MPTTDLELSASSSFDPLLALHSVELVYHMMLLRYGSAIARYCPRKPYRKTILCDIGTPQLQSQHSRLNATLSFCLMGIQQNQYKYNIARYSLFPLKTLVGSKIWEGDEQRKILFSESDGSLNGQSLFNELPFLISYLPKPSFTECLALIQ